jgi:tetratricopeptide (TPR) repeat protein
VEKYHRAWSGMATAALTGLLVAAGLVQVAGAQNAPAEKKYKDGEFDIYSAAANDVKANNFAQAIKDLDTWKQKFADTDFKTERQSLYIMAYFGAGQFDKTVDAAAPIIATGVDTVFSDPKDGPGQAIRVLFAAVAAIVRIPNPSAEQLAIADKAAHQLTDYNRKPPGPDGKPMSDADWNNARAQLQPQAKAALLYIAMLPGIQAMAKNPQDCAAAEVAYTKALGDYPDQTAASYNLALALSCQKKNSEAVYEFERAAVLDATLGGAQPDPGKIKTFADSAYAKVHGSDEGLAQLKDQVKQAPLWPAGFHIKTKAEIATEIAEQKQKALEQSDPELAMWVKIKAALNDSNGAQYFEEIKGADVPKLKGKLIDAKPACKSSTLLIAVPVPDEKEAPVAEIALKLDAPLTGKPTLDTEVEWKGLPSEFTQSPFLLTMDTEKTAVSGLKMTACTAAPARPAAKKK